MKFVNNIPEFQKLNSALQFETAEAKITGGIDLFTTKPAGTDKKLYKALDKQLYSLHQEHIQQQLDSLTYRNPLVENDFMPSSASPPSVSMYLGSPPPHHPTFTAGRGPSLAQSLDSRGAAYSESPFGPLDQPASRKTFAYLVSVLNATHPDHDFSSLQPEDFTRVPNAVKVINDFNNVLFGLGQAVPPGMWDALDEQIDLRDSVIYAHTPPQSFLEDEPGTMWSLMWFFYNKRRKRVAYLHIRAVRHHLSPLLNVMELDSSAKQRRKSSFGEYELEDPDYDLTYSSDTNSMDYEVVGGMEMDE
ncbi:repressor of RNA polymerase III transcription Maf1p [Trichomonascus vanleenenianus]|uniref:RNA polymerase III-inhibiting protein MAF1 n=1 Tax=Trichomonascus vanleenenianus TaxID=2268995 RepID=UPI003ECA3B12